MSKKLDLIKQEEIDRKNFWKDQQALNVFNLFVEGTEIPKIAESLSIRPLTVEKKITNRFFVERLEKHLRGLMFCHQVSAVIAKSDIFTKLWDRVRDNMGDIAPEVALKELTKLFPTKKDGMVINPKNMNVFMKVMQGGKDPETLGEQLEELDDDFGYEGLDDTGDYPELGDGKEDGIKSGDPKVDQTKPNKDEQRP